MISAENLAAAAARAEALQSEVTNLYQAACTPYGLPFHTNELHEMADTIGRASQRLKEMAGQMMAADLNDNNN